MTHRAGLPDEYSWRSARPPRWAEALLRRLLPSADSESISGDLLEHYREAVRPERGVLRANLWYLRQVASLSLRVAVGAKAGRIDDRGLGLALGSLLALAIVLTNVVLPKAGIDLPDADLDDTLFLGSLFLLFALAGLRSYRRNGSWRAALKSGATIAFFSILLAMLTFAVVDNLFLDLVSRQPEKVWSLAHSHDTSMRAHINRGILRGLFLFLPCLTVVGGLLGLVGGMVGQLTTTVRARFQGDRR